MEKSLRTTELSAQSGLVKEAALEALGGNAAGYTLMVAAPRRSLVSLKCMGLGALLSIMAVVYTVAVLIQKAFGETAWTFYWGWDALAFVAGVATLGIGAHKFLVIKVGAQAVAIFDGAVLRTGQASWFTQVLSALVYTGPIETNIVVRHPVRHSVKDKPVDLDFIFHARWQVADVLNLLRQGVEAVWLSITGKIATLCAEAVPAGDYAAVMAADLHQDREWQARIYEALLTALAGNSLACLALTLVDVRPPESLRQEEEKTRQARQAEEQRVTALRVGFETRRNQAAHEDDFAPISADIREAVLPEAVMAEELTLTAKAKRVFTQETKRRSAEARERVRRAAQGPVKAFIDGLNDANEQLETLCRQFHHDPVKVLLFLESQRMAAGNSGTPSLSSLLVQFADPTRLMLSSQEEPRGLSFRFAEEPGGADAANASDGPDPDKEKLGTVPLASTG